MRATQKIKKDLAAVFRHDPAARSKAEVILTYGGFHALVLYRFAHFLHVHRYRLLARIISQFAKFLTGIEIHPGAKIGYGVVIDHGEGVVIGETAEVGNNVLIYQGVTLGGTGKDKGKRHPTVEDGVMLCSGAKVLGPFTVGKNARIGAGSIVLKEVPPNATVVGVPGRIVKIGGERVDDLDQALPDPVTDELKSLSARIAVLEQRLADASGTKKATIPESGTAAKE
ncbi:MAG: serine O-acetyltransferase [Clostridia bacterium]|nr:serine O-acetyltransferase [Clostridia bacterium]